jgi:hypothetical protein
MVMVVDLSWWRSQLSHYLHGPYGLLLRVGYCVLGAAMAGLALALYRQLQAGARSCTALGLFCCSALALAGVAIGDSYLPAWNPALAEELHVAFAVTSFICVIVAIWLQSLQFRRDQRWRQHWRMASLLALTAFCALALHAGWKQAPRGVGQKLAIALIVLWLVRVGAWLAWPVAAGAVQTRLSRDNAAVTQRNGTQ